MIILELLAHMERTKRLWSRPPPLRSQCSAIFSRSSALSCRSDENRFDRSTHSRSRFMNQLQKKSLLIVVVSRLSSISENVNFYLKDWGNIIDGWVKFKFDVISHQYITIKQLFVTFSKSHLGISHFLIAEEFNNFTSIFYWHYNDKGIIYPKNDDRRETTTISTDFFDQLMHDTRTAARTVIKPVFIAVTSQC